MKEAGTRAPSLSAQSIERAAADLSQYLQPTPLQHSRALSEEAGCEVHLKIEALQPIRAFKVRGALTKLIRMSPVERAAGVITASAGNHGQGVAFAAAAFGVSATVYVPENANQLKVDAIRRLGGRVVHQGANYDQANLAAMSAQAESGATFIHAFDDADVIAGQGTIGVELLAGLPELDTVIVPVGGGGLIAGVSLYLKARRPGIRVIGVEPAGADAMTRSLEAGRSVTLDRVETMADGLAASRPGILTLEIARRCVDRMAVVQEPEILHAIRYCFEREHLLAEPAAAAALAAVLEGRCGSLRGPVAVILSGANITDEVMLRALGPVDRAAASAP